MNRKNLKDDSSKKGQIWKMTIPKRTHLKMDSSEQKSSSQL